MEVLYNTANQWRNVLSHLNPKPSYTVHPTNPLGPKFSEFIVISSKIRIRVIHLTPADVRESFRYSHRYPHKHNSGASMRESLSEEYWFSKWSQELNRSECNCLFRRSFRYSQPAKQSQNETVVQASPKRSSVLQSLPSKIYNVETFVERLIHDTLFEVFQEYCMPSNQNGGNGKVNFAFQNTEPDEPNKRLKVADSVDPNISGFSYKNKLQDKGNNANPPASLKVQTSQKTVGCIHRKAFKTKPLLVFFHGIGGSADIWWLVMNHMINKGYEVVAPDLLGHGYSTAPDGGSCYTFQNLLIQAIAIFDHYMTPESKRKCILIGHSYGCSIATGLYSHRPMHISHLILISGGGPNPLAAPAKKDGLPSFACLYTIFHPLLWCGVKRSWFYASRGKHFLPGKKECQCTLPNHIVSHLMKGQNWPEGDAAFHRRILVPTLLVHGLLDEEITLVQECEMERTIPRAFLELIPNAGHMSMLETPEQLSHMILCFIYSWC